MKDFTGIHKERILYQDELFFIVKDGFPVSPGHLLIISNEVRRDYFDLTDAEKVALPQVIDIAKDLILASAPT